MQALLSPLKLRHFEIFVMNRVHKTVARALYTVSGTIFSIVDPDLAVCCACYAVLTPMTLMLRVH